MESTFSLGYDLVDILPSADMKNWEGLKLHFLHGVNSKDASFNFFICFPQQLSYYCLNLSETLSLDGYVR